VADLNGDGKPDLLVANQCTSSICNGSVGVLSANGDGNFKTAVTYKCSGRAYSVAVADVNGDGKPDLLVGNRYGHGSVAVLINASTASTTTTSLVSSANPIVPNQQVTYTAKVTSQQGIAVTGAVSFKDGSGRTIGSVTGGIAVLNAATGSFPTGRRSPFTMAPRYSLRPKTLSGIATFSTSTLSAKTHEIKATYAGGATLNASSGTVRQIVKGHTSTTTLVAHPNPSAFGETSASSGA
jgi:hypothetical protein